MGGWRKPNGSDLDAAVSLLQRVTGIKGEFDVRDARAFVGPESPPRDDVGYLSRVTRWYIKGGVGSDPLARGRFLVEKRQFGVGVVAVAPYETSGFGSPDWRGFQLDGKPPRPVDGLPGRWSGVPYDFVEGGNGLGLPGLPTDVADCLRGT
ncbi:MAG: hypothetical protein WD004_04120 [Actinomycetota bacterium]